MDIAALCKMLDECIQQLAKANWKEREALKDQLLEKATNAGHRDAVVEHLTSVLKTLPLEVRWEIEEILEVLNPPPPPDPVEEEKEKESDKPLSAADLQIVYDDPRGLVLHKSKDGGRWFLTQPDPQTGQPKMFELGAQEVNQVKAQLKGSPYWVPGTGENPNL